MGLVIDDERAAALVRELAAREGTTPAQAVTRALEARLAASQDAASTSEAQRRRARERLVALQAKLAERGGQWPSWDDLKSWGQDGRD